MSRSARSSLVPLLAATAIACSPTPEPAAPEPMKPTEIRASGPTKVPDVRFVEITDEAGIAFRHANGASGKKWLPETMGPGVAFLDYDGDGDPDLFLVNSMAWPDAAPDPSPPTQALYRNDGKGHFEDVTRLAGLDRTLFGMGVAVGDYDDDGDPDLYLTALGGNILFRNDGKGHFEDATAEAGVRGDGWSTSAAFFDLENDGDLDLFVCRYVAWSREADEAVSTQLLGTGRGVAYDPPTTYGGSHCLLFRNDGGRFAEVGAEAGIRVLSADGRAPAAKALGVAPFDVDEDGRVDLAVANDTVPNFLFHNLGGGRFEEIGLASGISHDASGIARAGMGIDWADFRNDGSLGLAIGNYANEMIALFVTEEPASLLFSDLASSFGLGAPTQPPLKFGLFFFDYDLDGRLDLLSTNGHIEADIAKVQAGEAHAQAAQLFWNSGVPDRTLFTLADTEKVGPDLFRPIVGRGGAFADIDGDGDLDVVQVENGGPAHLYRNEGGSRNHWIRLELAGQGRSNRDALGARVEVLAGGKTARRQLFPSRGYLSTSEHPLTFGLGDVTRADRVRITWPSGASQELTDLAADRTYRIVEGPGEAP